jgi:hypothetical protein
MKCTVFFQTSIIISDNLFREKSYKPFLRYLPLRRALPTPQSRAARLCPAPGEGGKGKARLTRFEGENNSRIFRVSFVV